VHRTCQVLKFKKCHARVFRMQGKLAPTPRKKSKLEFCFRVQIFRKKNWSGFNVSIPDHYLRLRASLFLLSPSINSRPHFSSFSPTTTSSSHCLRWNVVMPRNRSLPPSEVKEPFRCSTKYPKKKGHGTWRIVLETFRPPAFPPLLISTRGGPGLGL
jgi:hypothetical protein